MRDDWGDQPDHRTPAPLTDEARKRAARLGIAKARRILAGNRETTETQDELEPQGAAVDRTTGTR